MAERIDDLAFLVGEWRGEGFRWDFRPAVGGMIFGDMQALEGGRTTYWETLRFAEEADGVAAYPMAMDRPGGRFAPAPSGPGEAVFAGPPESPFRTIGFRADGGRLVARVVGTKDGQPYDESWPMERA
jgi:hypothetical protein